MPNLTNADAAHVGGCLCGKVRYSYVGPLGTELGAVTVCHCRQCRKAQGYAAAVAPIEASGFSVTSGLDFIVEYNSSTLKKRAFCGLCGSPLYSRRTDAPGLMRLRLGSLDQAPASLRINAHIYVEGEPQWSAVDDAPRYAGAEPGRKT